MQWKHALKTILILETFLLSACASPDMSMFDSLRSGYQHFNKLMGFESAGEILVPGLDKEDALTEKADMIEEAVKAGHSIGKKREVGSILRQHREGCWYI
ncbi:MAG: hypothetical protein U0K57_04960 [Lachnospiraceae bacterium]|nr:hypothetical protein [Lachnospiraceae bacterium]